MVRTTDLLDKTPPNSLADEMAVVGSIVLDPARLDEVADVLDPGDFYDPRNATIFSALTELIDDGWRGDVQVMIEHLKRTQRLDGAGGIEHIAQTVQSVAVGAHALFHAKRVARCAAFRRLILAGTELIRRGYAEDGDPEAVLDAAEVILHRAGRSARGDDPVPLRDAILDALRRADAIQRRERSAGLLTGLENVDSEFGGLFAGELVVLAARPGMGKTALACQIALHAAEHGTGIYFASLEMSGRELAQRMVCGVAGVDSRRVRTGHLSPEDLSKLSDGAERLANAKLWIDGRSTMTVLELRRRARQHARDGLGLVVVDYLQLLAPSDPKAQRYQQVAQQTAGLKALARELDLPVLCLSQLNREGARDERPHLWHLRESGSIEQDSDMVLFLYEPTRPSKPDAAARYDQRWADVPDPERRRVLQVAKNRNGPTGAVRLEWLAERTLFRCPTGIEVFA